jgi:hypothetical protein
VNRRELFALLAGALVAPQALWTPARTIFLPPRGGWPTTPIVDYLWTADLVTGEFNVERFYRIVAKESRIPVRYLRGPELGSRVTRRRLRDGDSRCGEVRS